MELKGGKFTLSLVDDIKREEDDEEVSVIGLIEDKMSNSCRIQTRSIFIPLPLI